MAGPLVNMQMHLAESARAFFEQNGIEATGHLYAGDAPHSDTGIVSFEAFASRADDPSGYVLTYRGDHCHVALPPGRLIIMAHEAGFLKDASSTLPLDPLAFEDVMTLARQIGESFDGAGWKRVQYDSGIRQDTFGDSSLGGKFEYLGLWVPCNDERLRTYIKIKFYNSLPPGPSIPPVPGTPLPDDYPDRYIIEVLFRGNGLVLDDELTRLRNARRLAVNGNENEALTLKLWYDSPDWRPEGWKGEFVE